MSRNDPTFNDRQKTSQDAKLALLAKAKEKSVNSAEFAERQKERVAVAEARDKRHAERDAEKAARAEQIAAEKAAVEAEKKRLAEAEKLAREAEAQKKIQEALELKGLGSIFLKFRNIKILQNRKFL